MGKLPLGPHPPLLARIRETRPAQPALLADAAQLSGMAQPSAAPAHRAETSLTAPAQPHDDHGAGPRRADPVAQGAIASLRPTALPQIGDAEGSYLADTDA
jgi:hypothetical protein